MMELITFILVGALILLQIISMQFMMELRRRIAQLERERDENDFIIPNHPNCRCTLREPPDVYSRGMPL